MQQPCGATEEERSMLRQFSVRNLYSFSLDFTFTAKYCIILQVFKTPSHSPHSHTQCLDAGVSGLSCAAAAAVRCPR